MNQEKIFHYIMILTSRALELRKNYHEWLNLICYY